MVRLSLIRVGLVLLAVSAWTRGGLAQTIAAPSPSDESTPASAVSAWPAAAPIADASLGGAPTLADAGIGLNYCGYGNCGSPCYGIGANNCSGAGGGACGHPCTGRHCRHCCEASAVCDFLHSPCNLAQHYPYDPPCKGYYYFRPYHVCHLVAQQQLVAQWGGDTRKPYANEIFKQVYAAYAAAHGPAQPAVETQTAAPPQAPQPEPIVEAQPEPIVEAQPEPIAEPEALPAELTPGETLLESQPEPVGESLLPAPTESALP